MELQKLNTGLLQTSKEERTQIVSAIIEAIENGEANPLNVHLQVKCTEELIKSITSNQRYKDLTLSEAEKYGKSFEFHNAGFQIKEAGVKYDYSQCNDEIWNDLDKQIKALTEAQKAREKVLKSLPSEGMGTFNESTGEIARVYPPSKSSTTTIAVNLK